MSLPTAHEAPADETRPYAGPPKSDAHAVPNQDHGHGGPQMDLKPIGTGIVLMLIGGFAVMLAALFAIGYIPRASSKEAAEKESKEATEGRQIVGVTLPKPPAKMPALELPGDAQAFQMTNIYPRTSGYLKRRLVDIGDSVKEGQLLAEIDTPEIDAQLEAAKATLQQAQAAQQRAKDDYELAQATYERYEGFSKGGGVTQQQLDERKSTFTTAKAALAGADANVKADQAEVQRLSALQGFKNVVAPFNGTITTRGYDVGALLTANNSSGRELFQIQQTDMLRVFIDMPQAYTSSVKVGQPVKFQVRNYPGQWFEGFVARASGAINQQTRTMRIEADFPNKDAALYPGMYGTVRYEINQPTQQMVIPASALVFGPEGMQVAVVENDNKVKFKKVTLGVDLGQEVEVTNGVDKHDRIVSNPGERLIDGTEVQIAEKKDNAQGGKTQTASGEPKPSANSAEASAK